MPWSPCSTLTLFAQAPLPVRKRSLGTEEAKAQAALVGMKTVPKGYKVEVPVEEETCKEEEETMEGVVVTPAERAKRRRSKAGGNEKAEESKD